MSTQQTLDGTLLDFPEHLSKTQPKGQGTELTADGERECWCRDCGRRVTRATQRRVEYGHDVDCEHAIDGGGGW